MKVTVDDLLEKLRNGESWRPTRWNNAALFENGYCTIENLHTFVQHTPNTVSVRISPASVGVVSTMDQFGDDWEKYDEHPTP